MTAYPKTLALVGTVLLWTSLACSGLEDSIKPAPIPEDRKTYIGSWSSDHVDLTISPEGQCSFEKRSKSGATTSLNAPIQAWHKTGFDVGIGPMVTTFEVNKPPKKAKGQWKMTLDNEVLTKK
jgi:hypothetical protein